MCVLVSLILVVLTGATGARVNINWDSDAVGHSYNVIPSIVAGATGIAWLVKIFVSAPGEIGCRRFFMENRYHRVGIERILYAFKSGSYGNCVLIMVLKWLFTCLWTLLLVVPGIVKYYEYRMIPYILSENPSMDRQRAFELSKQMMHGEKMETFILDWSFIGWYIVGCLTCGIGAVLYVSPYVNAANAELYTALRTKAIAEGLVQPGELPGFENPGDESNEF